MNYTAEQLRAIETTGRHLCVDAGAGSGKTRVLVDRIIYLLENHLATLDEIVAITFTEKAAAEMKGRLREAFHKKALLEDEPTDMTYWRALERQTDDARIATIHAFCAGIIREHALALGLDPDFRLLAEAESTLMRRRVAEECVERLARSGDRNALRAGAEYGVASLTGMLTGLLGRAGLMARVSATHLLDDPEALAREWESIVETERCARLCAFARSRSVARAIDALASFEGLCTKPTDNRELMRVESIELLRAIQGSTNPDAIAARLDSIAGLAARGSRRANWEDAAQLDALMSVQKGLKKLVGEQQPFDDDPVDRAEAAELTVACVALYRAADEGYRAEKRRNSSLDFDDLIDLALEALDTKRALRDRTAGGIKHLLIDEFQDTDRAQLDIARLLRREDGKPGAEVFIVGDAKQSIYAFRGAEVEVFAAAREESSDVIPLATNFRSSPQILAFINEYFQVSRSLDSPSQPFAALAAHREPGPEPTIEFLLPDVAEKTPLGDVRAAEAKLIASRIAELCAPSASEAVSYGDVAILFRAASNVYLYEEQLRRYGIPFHVVAGRGFFDRQEVRDLTNLLKAAYDGQNEMALLGFLRSPAAALSDESLFRLTRDSTLTEAFDSDATLDDEEQNERLVRARAIIAELRGAFQFSLQEVVRVALNESALESVVVAGPHGAQRAGNLRKVIDVAGEFDSVDAGTMSAFLNYLDEAASRGFQEGDAPVDGGTSGAVTLMTIHKAKGLEFPVVVIADAARGKQSPRGAGGLRIHRRLGAAVTFTGPKGKTVSPAIVETIKAAERAEEEAESARVLYVAMTRAKDRLLVGGGMAKLGSWLADIDSVFEIAEKPHNASVRGKGWEGRVYREAAPAPKAVRDASSSGERHGALDWNSMIEPVSVPSAVDGVVSVSELLTYMSDDAQHDSEAFGPRRGSSTDAIDPAIFGSAVHRCLECWDFASGNEPDVNAVAVEFARTPKQREVFVAELGECVAGIRASKFYARLASGSVEKEIPFMLRLGATTVSGTIDAFLSDGTIVDYKTGDPERANRARYEDQLRLYALAALRVGGMRPNGAVIFFVDTGETHEVDIATAALEDTLQRAAEAVAEYGRA